MSRLSVVVDKIEDWADFYPSADVISLATYLNDVDASDGRGKRRVINLCREYTYLGTGYYCSLLAEARGHRVVPSLQGLGDLDRKSASLHLSSEVCRFLDSDEINRENQTEDTYTTAFYFGIAAEKPLMKLARHFFEVYSLPIIHLTFVKNNDWQLKKLKPIGLRDLNAEQKTAFATALDKFSGLIWRKSKKHWSPKFEMAILIDPDEAMPPSDSSALKRMIAAAKREDIYAQTIGPKDIDRLAEFDALFIRTTTAVNHFTYKFARKAEQLGLVVIDDSKSILRCTNKIFLAKMFETLGLPAPKTRLLSNLEPENIEHVIEDLGLPLILKIPDGAFSIGVHKIESIEDMQEKLDALFKKSSFVIAQQFCYTEYDWRIGVLNGQAFYACRYYMVKGHWAIYTHDVKEKAAPKTGGFDAMPTYEVPKKVLKTAIEATKAIGNGLYGVDLKQRGDEVLLIEVNDNPSIDHGVEDGYLGDGLYDCIMIEFRRRLDALKRNH